MNKIIKNILTSDIYSIIKKTPLNYANNLSKQYKNNLYFKREDLLPIFSFKLRGAYNKISKLSNKEKKNRIIACSAGNHAQGVAYSCKKLGLESTIIMPRIAPDIKIEAVKNLGANIVVGIGKKKDNSNVGYIYEIIPAGKIVEAVILEPPEIATNPICIENAKMNGLNLIDSLEEFHKK